VGGGGGRRREEGGRREGGEMGEGKGGGGVAEGVCKKFGGGEGRRPHLLYQDKEKWR